MQKSLTTVHTALAAFFLPMGIMYAVTGGLYGLNVKGDYATQEHQIELSEPLPSELSQLTAIAEEQLRSRGLEFPTGGARIRKGGTSFYFEWTGSRRDVELHPTYEPDQAVLKIKDVNAHRFFVQLHKAKGGTQFKWFAAAWMVGLVGLFLSGGVLAFLAPPFRRIAVISGILGIAAFIGLAATS